MNMQRLQPYPLLTRLSAAVYAGDTALAQEVLREAVLTNHDPSTINSIIKGKRIALPDRLPPMTSGTNLDDCINSYGHHNGYPHQTRKA